MNFELDLKTGQVSTYLSPPENIGISCQKDPFDLELLRNMLREEQDISMTQEEALERIPNIKKLAGPADTMSLEETEQKIRQFCQLWQLYADISVELKKKSELSQDSTVAACRVYVPYMSDITRQLEEVRKIFAIEKELRTIKNRGYFPVPHINPQEEKIETANDKDKILERIDEIATAMIQAARQSEENFAREQEQARVRDEQLRSVRQTDRSGLNFFAQANSTPVRNDNSRADNQGVHFKANPTRHVYSTTSDDNNPYEPPENDSIIQTVSLPQTDQPMTSTTKPVNHNTPWRHNSNTGTTVGTVTHRTASVTTTDNRSGPICFRCGERGHLRFNCTERVFCDFCKTFNHSSRTCRKQTDNVLVRDHTSKAFQPKYKDFCIIGLLGKNQVEIKDNHGHITKVHRKDLKKIPMTEKVCQLYKEEQLGRTREGRKAVPANKMPDLGWDIAETTEIKENRQKTNNIPLALQTIVTIIIIISVIIRLSTTQLGRLAMFLKEAVITTLRVSRSAYRQNKERFHNTTIAAITIATSTTNWIDRDEKNPNIDRNSHTSVNSRKPNDEHDYSYRSHPPRRSGTYSD